MHMHMQPRPPSAFNPGVSPTIEKVLLRVLAKKPEDRYASIAEFTKSFQQYSK